MELIIKAHGKFLLEAVAFATFWVLVFAGVRDSQGNVGFFYMLGSYVDEEQVAYGADFSSCIEESKRSAPEISYKKEGALRVGIYNVSEILGASDCEGKEVSIQIQEIYNPQGTFNMEIYDADTMQISFENAGIYTLQVCAVDERNNARVCRICIPVNG